MSAVTLERKVRRVLSAVAEPGRAEPMRAYMKSAMPYLGVPTAARRRVSRSLFADVELETAAAWRRAVLTLWRGARYRSDRRATRLAGRRPPGRA